MAGGTAAAVDTEEVVEEEGEKDVDSPLSEGVESWFGAAKSVKRPLGFMAVAPLGPIFTLAPSSSLVTVGRSSSSLRNIRERKNRIIGGWKVKVK